MHLTGGEGAIRATVERDSGASFLPLLVHFVVVVDRAGPTPGRALFGGKELQGSLGGSSECFLSAYLSYLLSINYFIANIDPSGVTITDLSIAINS